MGEPKPGGLLAQMAAGIMEHKSSAVAKSTKLTPVSGEGESPRTLEAPLAGKQPVPFPFDNAETVLVALDKARTEVMHVLASIETLMTLYGGTPPEVRPVEVTEEDATKEKERVADAKHNSKDDTEDEDPPEAQVRAMVEEDVEDFSARMARLQADAKRKTFTQQAKGDDVPERQVETGVWACPDHGDQSLNQVVSPKGRHFIRCSAPGCKQFEK